MHRLFTLIALTGSIALLTPATSRAQHFSFSVGGGHHHGYHHHHGHWHGCGPYWGPHWYGPALGYTYVAPPVVRERVVYVQPPQTSPQSQANYPLTAAPTNTNPSMAGSYVTIRNGSGSRLPVAFLVDGQDVELADGQTQSFTGAGQRIIHYDRGGNYGSTQQNLTAGNYEFRITSSGWDLVRQPDVPAAGRAAVRANTLPTR
jgi:hypothetical protein